MYNLSSLSSLLEKFKNLKNPREEREDLIATLVQNLGFEIPFDDVDLKSDILYLNISPYVKTEVFMRKEQLIEVLNKKGFKIKDIR